MPLIYLVLAVVGGIVPYIFFIQHFAEAGPGMAEFVAAAFINGAAGGILAPASA